MEKQNPKVSVIVPIYNVEKYLGRCVDSILNQNFKDFELILVNDGSTDSSGKICEQYKDVDQRIKVIYKENGGLSDARNFGIDIATGEYFTFIDSDDYIGENYLKYLVEMAEKYDVDISIIRSKNVYEGDAVERGTELENVVSYNTQDALSHMCQNVKFGVSAWGKLYKRMLFDEIRYPKGKLYEDLLTTPYIFAKANGVVFGDTIQYFWLQRNESIMHRKISEKDLELFDGMDKLIQFIDRNYPDIHDAAICRFANDSFWTIVQRLANSDQYDSMIDYIIRRCKKNWKEALSNKYVPKRKKLNIMMILINKKLYKKIYNLHSKNKR